jgi:hypothetical protein
MATITLRQSNSTPHSGATVKGTPLTNDEVDNNFANINISIGSLSDLTTSNTANIVVAVNEVKAATAAIVDPIPFAIALG